MPQRAGDWRRRRQIHGAAARNQHRNSRRRSRCQPGNVAGAYPWGGPNAERVCTEVADARAWQPKNATLYDLVVTHFFLDCLTTAEIKQLAASIQAAAAPEAMWVVSEFAIPHSLFGRLVARPLVSTLYLAFAILTGLKVRILPDHASALPEAGFQLARRRTRLSGLLVSELWTNQKAR